MGRIRRLINKKILVVSIVIFMITFFCCGGVNIITKIATSTMTYLNSLMKKDEEIKSVTFTTDGYETNNPGDYEIVKSADWTGINKATIEFNLETNVMTSGNKKDVIFVVDTSGSMAGEKYDRLSRDYVELLTKLLNDEENRAALVMFSTESEILSGFTNDKELLIEQISNLPIVGSTNYYAALKSVDEILSTYEKSDDRDCVVVLLTDGYPTVNNTNQVAQFEVINDKYKFVTIQGVQYEMGVDVTQQLIEVSHKQYSIDMDSLRNVLFDVTFSPYPYQKFEIVDYIDNEYFYVESIEDITVDVGTVQLTEENGQQKVVWNVASDEFLSGEKANMKIDVVLKDEHVSQGGLYSTNEKFETNVVIDNKDKSYNTSQTPVLQHGYNVVYDVNTPAGCILEDYPTEEHNAFVTVEKQDYKPMCPGYVFKGWETEDKLNYINSDYFIMPTKNVTFRATWTRFSILKSMDGKVYEKQTLYKVVKQEAEKNNGNALEYTGLDSENYQNKVYYYTGDFDNNHVLFAGYCWEIVRTTDTGGVKLLYDGLPQNGECNNLGTDTFLSTGKYNANTNSLGYFGYMYNTLYTHGYKNLTTTKTTNILEQKTMTGTNYLYSTSITDNGTSFTLNNPIQLTWNDNYNDLEGYYTCLSGTNSTCTTVSYVVAAEETTGYFFTLKSGKTFDENNRIVVGSKVISNGDGTFTIVDPTTISKKDWYKNYNNNVKYYLCSDTTSTTCSDMRFITSSTNKSYAYVAPTIFGNDFVYDEATSTYTLVDTKVVADWANEYDDIENHHYTCINTTGKCTDSVKYVYFSSNVYIYYYSLKNGKSINDALSEMLWDDNVNTKDSTIKTTIDTWYSNNMVDYTNYIEDTIYCNDRRIENYSGWSPSGETNVNLAFYSNVYRDLTCPNRNDQFTVSGEIGNGKLTYPVGLLTAAEADMAGYGAIGVDNYYWLLSPSIFSSHSAYHYTMSSYPTLGLDNIPINYTKIAVGVRPVISLVPEIGYVSGDGSPERPYVINSRSLE